MRTALLGGVGLPILALALSACCGKPCCPPDGPAPAVAPAPVPMPTPDAGKPPAPPVVIAPPARADAPPTLGEAPAAATPKARLAAALAVKKGEPKVRMAAGTGYGQVTLQNNTSLTLDLYVDGNYGCRTLMNLMCTTQVPAGTHTLEARGPNGESASTPVTLGEGDSVTWTVTEE